jgi:hypothetical protein
MYEVPVGVGRTALHIAPHPAGGWIVEDEHHRIAPSRYLDLREAVAEAEAYAADRDEWHVIVHDQSNPAVGDVAPSEADAPDLDSSSVAVPRQVG